MKALIVYDTRHGNTVQIAQAIGEAIAGQVLQASQVTPAALKGVDLLIVGSPTHGGFPSPAIDSLLKELSDLEGTKVAAFDTRTKRTVFGYAAPKIAKALEGKGGAAVGRPGGFYVLGIKGPLTEGEIDRAIAWAKTLVGSESDAAVMG